MSENKYEEIIAKYTAEQLIYEQAIINEEETTLYNKKKALKEEFKKRLRGDYNGNTCSYYGRKWKW